MRPIPEVIRAHKITPILLPIPSHGEGSWIQPKRGGGVRSSGTAGEPEYRHPKGLRVYENPPISPELDKSGARAWIVRNGQEMAPASTHGAPRVRVAPDASRGQTAARSEPAPSKHT